MLAESVAISSIAPRMTEAKKDIEIYSYILGIDPPSKMLNHLNPVCPRFSSSHGCSPVNIKKGTRNHASRQYKLDLIKFMPFKLIGEFNRP
jgi:hypothetical protein